MGDLMTYDIQNISEQNSDDHIFIPKPEYTKGQPAPIAANNGLSFMSFDRNGDGGSAAATAAALDQIRDPKNVNSELDLAHDANGGIRTKWGLGFTEYDDCVSYINTRKFDIPEGGGRQTVGGKIAKFLGIKEESRYLEDGRLVKVPNLALLTPFGAPFLIPHLKNSFFPSGEKEQVSEASISGGEESSSEMKEVTDPKEKKRILDTV